MIIVALAAALKKGNHIDTGKKQKLYYKRDIKTLQSLLKQAILFLNAKNVIGQTETIGYMMIKQGEISMKTAVIYYSAHHGNTKKYWTPLPGASTSPSSTQSKPTPPTLRDMT